MVAPYATGPGGFGGIGINHYYDLPVFTTGGASDSKLLDEQAIFEGTLTLHGQTLSGGNMIHDMGYMESGLTGSLELMVIQDEIVSIIKAGSMNGLDFSEENLALDLVHQHALSADFMGTEHNAYTIVVRAGSHVWSTGRTTPSGRPAARCRCVIEPGRKSMKSWPKSRVTYCRPILRSRSAQLPTGLLPPRHGKSRRLTACYNHL